MPKYVVQLRAEADDQGPPLETIVDNLLDPDDDRVWEREYHQSQHHDDINGKEVLSAHIPFETEADAKDHFGKLTALDAIANAHNVELHVHECPTSGGPDAWACNDRILEEY